jgi:flagellar hook-associated protein 3 FlgL
MAMRITENMKLNTTLASLSNVQSQYNSVLEQMSSQKRINKISDDPLGMTVLLGYRQVEASLDQYRSNIDASNGWLSLTETKLSSVGDLLTNASEIAVQQGTATASAESRLIMAENVRQLKEEMLSLANSKYGNRYLFSGSRMDTDPFSSASATARIDDPIAVSGNAFDGGVAKSGTYTGTTNKTYAVKIVSGGTPAVSPYPTYLVSSDGGKTWGTVPTDLDTGTITLGDGISLTFTAGAVDMAADDLFYVQAYAEGYYNGNDDDLTVNIGKDASISYNVTGADAFTASGGVDIFKIFDDLKTALENDDKETILAQLDKLDTAQQQVNLAVSKVGALMNRLEIAGSNLEDFSLQITELKSETEDADIMELATSLATKELALQASYAVAAKIGRNTILDFIS